MGCCAVRPVPKAKPSSGCMTLGPEQLLERRKLLQQRSAQSSTSTATRPPAEPLEHERTGTEVSALTETSDCSDASNNSRLPDSFRAAFGPRRSARPSPFHSDSDSMLSAPIQTKTTRRTKSSKACHSKKSPNISPTTRPKRKARKQSAVTESSTVPRVAPGKSSRSKAPASKVPTQQQGKSRQPVVAPNTIKIDF